MNALAQLLDPAAASAPPLDQGERKYLLEAGAARSFWSIATNHLRPQIDVEGRPVAYSRTTYFDTPDLAYYRSGLGSVAQRLRVREYAHAARPDERPVVGERVFVELKQSANGLRSKRRIETDAAGAAAALAELSGEAKLEACVATWYRRRALTDEAGLLRVTLDERLMLCRPRSLGSPFASLRADEIVGQGPEFILEVKTWGAPPAWLRNALIGRREAVGFSKFMIGMRAAGAQAHGETREQRAA